MRRAFLPAIFLLILLSACGHAPPRDDARSRPASTPANRSAGHTANAVLFRALALVGTPYRYGGNTPEGGFDCSGLVGYVFRDAAGIDLPRTSAAIAALPSPRLAADDLRSGDLVLFGNRRTITHVGIYVGERRFVHAPNSGGTVRLDSLDTRGWRETFRHGQRIIR
ncbi:MAG TPA: C40 family peptidase [Dokdonella sp.]|uniref:C40 family peptidase n=1 Tax=Dokdonella sp. TaxID=2291710 RepID=UPI0025BD095E|nr:C40 family peptidase [Dokdonella sp.]MBX3693370.1 C40 family peptidase [Dokdonella sp.]MCW5567198.1 C40 family peptidase [Dokdonella sp.]HNR92224.1 C40 family peptidase [Dokdonella sp.]